jgi:hypothetical protein
MKNIPRFSDSLLVQQWIVGIMLFIIYAKIFRILILLSLRSTKMCIKFMQNIASDGENINLGYKQYCTKNFETPISSSIC